MTDLIRAVRQTAAAALKKQDPQLLRLRAEIEDTRHAIETARNHFEQEVDPTLIDCCIYEWNAAQLRYQFLLRKFKSWEL